MSDKLQNAHIRKTLKMFLCCYLIYCLGRMFVSLLFNQNFLWWLESTFTFLWATLCYKPTYSILSISFVNMKKIIVQGFD
jgi:hypothetical protein